MGTLLKELTGAINDVDRAAAPPGTRRQRADGRIYVKQPDGSWTPEPGQEQKPEQREPGAEADGLAIAPTGFESITSEDAFEGLSWEQQNAYLSGKAGQVSDTMGVSTDEATRAMEFLSGGEGTQDPTAWTSADFQEAFEDLGIEASPQPERRRKEKADVQKVLPSPSGGESQDKYVGRCMSWMDDNEGDRPQDQQLAMCFTKFRESKEQGGQTVTRAELFAEVQQNAGYLVKIATRIQAQKQDGAKGRMEGAPEDLEADDVDKDNGVGHRMEGAPEQAAGG